MDVLFQFLTSFSLGSGIILSCTSIISEWQNRTMPLEEGDLCPYCDHPTVLTYKGDGCTCMVTNPPCSYCCSSFLFCKECYIDFSETDDL